MNTKIIGQVEESHLNKEIPSMRIGDTVRLGMKVTDRKEGERIQYFEGVLIRKSGSGLRETITVRKIGANSIGVERIVPLHAPVLASVTVTKQGRARRARLYYLRDRVGKAALAIQERIAK